VSSWHASPCTSSVEAFLVLTMPTMVLSAHDDGAGEPLFSSHMIDLSEESLEVGVTDL